METRGRAKAQAASSTPVSPLEGQGTRPLSTVSEDEGDLGLASLLGEGAVLDVGENHTRESALRGSGDVTVVAAQAPTTEVKLAFSDGQTEAGSADPVLAATGATRLPDPRAQAPIGSTQVPPLSLSRGSEPVQIPSRHLGGEVQILHCFPKGQGDRQSLMNGHHVLQHLVMLILLNVIIVLLVMLMKCIGMRTLIHIPLGM